MEFLTDISMWIGLLTLVILEIVLGVDNLVFISILADKLPKKQRERACIIGLTLALIMRIALLSLISWFVTLTKPLCKIATFLFSGRDLILLFGGIFLLFKATTELHQQLEHKTHNHTNRGYASFWVVVIQIVVFDAIFSLDAVITAVGTVENLTIMIIAVVIAVVIMSLSSRLLTNFINSHQTVVVLCLSFLLIIGLSLIAEGIGFYIPKGYLYVAIGFSVFIELFNQVAHCNSMKGQSTKSMRERTAEAIMRLMGNTVQWSVDTEKNSSVLLSKTHFAEEERHMITGVLSLASRTLRSIMTPRNEISWLDSQKPVQELYATLMNTPHNMFPVCNGELDQLIGIVRAKDLMAAISNGERLETHASENLPIVVPETLDVLNLLKELRRAKGSMVVVSNEFGIIQGLITPLDVLEAIAGEFPDEDETPEIEIINNGTGWLVKGSTDLHALQQALQAHDLVHVCDHVASLAGLLLSRCDRIPKEGDVLTINRWRFIIRKMIEYRIELVEIECLLFSNDTHH
ncbi:TerC family protein [Blochmannia endosymbiont of Camponotus sp. C-003]|uniref:TerC family protein n=1 Tax=unclassified Candidatus Blochmanniella TaxID=711328 RepID=UPI00202410C3|nr:MULTISPECIES: TerC family protein [unclassified Candidatus Blochmannia]URJ23381.1 TerC family protein [Blochmannia endosymbiont of Camponotus sp. C-003]URJ28854.1 TerC family protein [Blochmannia endosymbiont of Camponotus sp. C-046]